MSEAILPSGVNPFRGTPLSAAFGAFRRRKAERVAKVIITADYSSKYAKVTTSALNIKNNYSLSTANSSVFPYHGV